MGAIAKPRMYTANMFAFIDTILHVFTCKQYISSQYKPCITNIAITFLNFKVILSIEALHGFTDSISLNESPKLALADINNYCMSTESPSSIEVIQTLPSTGAFDPPTQVTIKRNHDKAKHTCNVNEI